MWYVLSRRRWWLISSTQAKWLLQAFKQALQSLSLPGVRVLDFPRYNATFFSQVWGRTGRATVRDSAGNRIDVRNSRREPADRLNGTDTGLRLVHQFAGDSNAYPGNEFWIGGVTGSGDPATAACSLIPWLQNVDINPSGLSGQRSHVVG
jgi:hypothetical protein